MARTDLWRWSAARVEIDHRSREARLREEYLERLLILRALPARSWVRRVLYRLAARLFNGGRVAGRSTEETPASARQSLQFTTGACIAASGLTAASLAVNDNVARTHCAA
jgi:hypothetical protein